MAAAKLSRVSTSLLSSGSLGTMSSQGRSMAEALDQHSVQRNAVQQDAPAEHAASSVPSVRKTLHLHIGADLQIPVRENKFVHPSREGAAAVSRRDPFEGLPLRAWAEKLGERVMPAYEVIKEEQAAAKRAAKALGKKVQAELHVPSIPHILPFTRWAAQSNVIQNTFVAKEGKDRKKARLSWYHPDDTMVPRDWFRGGLLKDLAYYKPFTS